MSSECRRSARTPAPGASSASSLQALLDEVLDRLDVVVGGALDLLDPRRLGDDRSSASASQARGGGVGERRQLGDARLGGQRHQPLDLDPHARPIRPNSEKIGRSASTLPA